ncbi:MAG: ribosome biogenesis GTPase Der [Candidatus Neomarinimicrobiota bacterium]
MAKPVIAIVGRPNVGKSTLFNRLLNERRAIVDAQEGITRDRSYGEVEWSNHYLTFIDTGGYIPEDLDIFNAAVRRQAQVAIGEADLVVLMVDGRTAPTSSDRALAQFVRETGKPNLLVVNKCDTLEQDVQIAQFYELGLEEIHPLSALSGRLSGDLLDAILKKLNLPLSGTGKSDDDEQLRLAIVGMPNVGKSSLANALLQEEKTIVTPIAGTTRDAIDSTLKWYGKTIILTDTAGLRKKARVKDSIEYYSSVRTERAIANSHVALVLIDATKGFSTHDRAIVSHVIEQGRGLILLVNKWDLMTKETNTMRDFQAEIAYQFKSLEHYPLLFISALTHQRISKILTLAQKVHESWRRKVGTRELNEFLQQATDTLRVPAVHGKVITLKYITQVTIAPPLFAVFCNYPKLVPVAYQRYLENRLRESFDLQGVPVKLSFRKK